MIKWAGIEFPHNLTGLVSASPQFLQRLPLSKPVVCWWAVTVTHVLNDKNRPPLPLAHVLCGCSVAILPHCDKAPAAPPWPQCMTHNTSHTPRSHDEERTLRLWPQNPGHSHSGALLCKYPPYIKANRPVNVLKIMICLNVPVPLNCKSPELKK